MIHDCHGKWLKMFRCFEDVAKIKRKQADFLWYKYETGIPGFARCLALQPFLTIENPTDACGS